MGRITLYIRTLQRNTALDYILTFANQDHAKALTIDENRLALISDIADNFPINSDSYEPRGKVTQVTHLIYPVKRLSFMTALASML